MRHPILLAAPVICLAALAFALSATGGELPAAAGPGNPVYTLDLDDEGAGWKVSPSGQTRMLKMAEGKNAFFALLMLEPGAAIPFHRDSTEEYLLIMEGGGTLTMDGQAYTLKEGSVVYMHPNAEVAYLNGSRETFGFQIFAGPEPASKYATWVDLANSPVVKNDERDDRLADVNGIRTAEKAYHAEWDAFTSTPTCPGGLPGPDSRPFAGDCATAWYNLGWVPDGDTKCQFRVQAKAGASYSDDDFDDWAECDLDGDGKRSIIHANRAEKATLVTPADVY